MARYLKERLRVPRGPVTWMVLPWSSTLTVKRQTQEKHKD
jgi:hypothetical protein